jgi:hypothetical protein
MQVVNFAYLRSPQEAFPWATLQMGRMHHTLELWQVGRVGGAVGGWGLMRTLQHNGRAGGQGSTSCWAEMQMQAIDWVSDMMAQPLEGANGAVPGGGCVCVHSGRCA